MRRGEIRKTGTKSSQSRVENKLNPQSASSLESKPGHIGRRRVLSPRRWTPLLIGHALLRTQNFSRNFMPQKQPCFLGDPQAVILAFDLSICSRHSCRVMDPLLSSYIKKKMRISTITFHKLVSTKEWLTIDCCLLEMLEYSEDSHPWETMEEKLTNIRYITRTFSVRMRYTMDYTPYRTCLIWMDNFWIVANYPCYKLSALKATPGSLTPLLQLQSHEWWNFSLIPQVAIIWMVELHLYPAKVTIIWMMDLHAHPAPPPPPQVAIIWKVELS